MSDKNTVTCARCGRKTQKTSGEYLVTKGRVLCKLCVREELSRTVSSGQTDKTSLNMAVASGEITPEQATIASAKNSKTKLIWAIVLFFIGVVGLGNAANEERSYLIVCILLIAAGLLLLAIWFFGKKKLADAIKTERERRLRIKESRETAAKNASKTCPHCGAATKGEICEYCGSPLI